MVMESRGEDEADQAWSTGELVQVGNNREREGSGRHTALERVNSDISEQKNNKKNIFEIHFDPLVRYLK